MLQDKIVAKVTEGLFLPEKKEKRFYKLGNFFFPFLNLYIFRKNSSKQNPKQAQKVQKGTSHYITTTYRSNTPFYLNKKTNLTAQHIKYHIP